MMAPSKRKHEDTNRGPAGQSTETTKRQKPSNVPGVMKDNDKAASKDDDIRPLAVSKLKAPKNEGKAFPRGGASALTPIEYKEAVNEATRDVLFETKTGAANEDGEGPARKKKRAKIEHKRRSKDKSKGHFKENDDEDKIRIESLSYKRLVPGAIVLGTVTQVNVTDIALSIPNNLTGFVPITSISEAFTNKLERLADDEEGLSENESSDAPEAATADAARMVKVGQWLRAYVTESTSAFEVKQGSGTKKHIQLSLLPQLANSSLTHADLIKGNTVQASVKSVEDQGLIMDLGIDGVTGFIGSKFIGTPKSEIVEGQVFLCLVLGTASDGKVIKLSSDFAKGVGKNNNAAQSLSQAPAITSFLPGTLADWLVTEVRENGLVGKIMGMLDTTVELIHSGFLDSSEMLKKFSVGKNIKGRIICTFSDPQKVVISLLSHIVGLEAGEARRDLPIGTIMDAKVKKVHPGAGLFLDFGADSLAFVHISRVSSDKKIEDLSETTGPYKIGSKHKARITGYNAFEKTFLASMEQRVLEQAFLRSEDVKVGEVVKGIIKEVVGNGVVVTLADGVYGHVPELHLSDTKLTHPERKFRKDAKVTARVLTNAGRIILTLKKTLVHSEAPLIATYEDAQVGMTCPGTLSKILPNGAFVRFYGTVHSFLPVTEMSEAFIKDAREHFREGQVVNVTVTSVDAESKKMKVSCRDPSSFDTEKEAAFQDLKIGATVSGKIIEKTQDDLSLELKESGLKAHLAMGQLADGSKEKAFSAFKRLQAGQTLSGLLVLNKHDKKKSITLTNKPSLIEAARSGGLLQDISKLNPGGAAVGFVKDIISSGVFVEFLGGLTGFLPKKALPLEVASNVDFGYTRLQTFKGFVGGVYPDQDRFTLSLQPPKKPEAKPETKPEETTISTRPAVNPVDRSVKSADEYIFGKVTKAKITAIKDTQINVDLADNVRGRIDMTQVFSSWESIKNKKRPLNKHGFKIGNELDVKIIGHHDHKNHTYLPITHRTGGMDVVYELTTNFASPLLSMKDLRIGDDVIAFVNSVSSDCLWVNVTPSVRGRVYVLNASHSVTELNHLEAHFPVGSALQCKVVNVDAGSNKLDLALKDKPAATWDTISTGLVCPVRVTRVADSKVSVQLSNTISGIVGLADMADDFKLATPNKFSKGSVISACIIDIDRPNKRIHFSTRPSRVLNSSAPVQDQEITSLKDLHVGDIRRGFITNVADTGVFVDLGNSVSARVRIADLTDEFVKNWRAGFTVDQLVTGKILSVDQNTNKVSMSLKKSVIDGTAKPTLADFKKGQIVEGHIRKVTDYGVFIVIDGSNNVSGLCYKTELADNSSKAPVELYAEGDLVKAKILRINRAESKISFGLKASYFKNLDTDMDVDEEGGVPLANGGDGGDNDADAEGDVSMTLNGKNGGEELADEGLQPVDFSWTGESAEKHSLSSDSEPESESEDETAQKQKKRRLTEIKEDKTNDLNSRDAQSRTDYERMLLAEPNSSHLWVSYMAYEVQQGKLDTARAVAERALKTINIREDEEKLNVWIAMLNLENSFSTEESMEEVLQRAIQYNDAQTVYEKLCSIYIQSGKIEKADEAFQRLTKKFSQSPRVWINYASFLFDKSRPEDARKLLPRMVQSIQDKRLHVEGTTKFAQLEYKAGNTEKGRTLFEKLLDAYPKRSDLWNVYIDTEIKTNDKEMVRRLFPRVFSEQNKMNPKNARVFFKKWLAYEEKNGDKKTVEAVKVRAAEYVKAAAAEKSKHKYDDSDEE